MTAYEYRAVRLAIGCPGDMLAVRRLGSLQVSMSKATQAQLGRLGAATDSSSGSAARWPTHDRLPREQATDCDKAPLCETPYKIATSNISHRGERFPPPRVDAAKENGHADALLVSFRHYE